MQIDDETLMALADGEIDPPRADDLRRAIAADPDLQSRLHRFEETRRLLGELRQAPQPATATEDPLAAMIRAAAKSAPPQSSAAPQEKPASFRPAPTPVAAAPANLNRRPWMLAAASVAVVALGLGWWEWSGVTGPQGFSAAELAALESQPSGEVQAIEGGTDLAMIASFRLEDGAFCREFETSNGDELRTVLACRDVDGWSERFASAMPEDSQDYRPASGEGSIDEALAALGAGDPLSPEEEAQALTE